MKKAILFCLSLVCLFGFSARNLSRHNTALVQSTSETVTIQTLPANDPQTSLEDNDTPIDPCDAAIIVILHAGSLKDNLTRIAAENEWPELIWNSDKDYTWTGETALEGDSLDAIFDQILNHHYPLQATFYQGNHVIVIAPKPLNDGNQEFLMKPVHKSPFRLTTTLLSCLTLAHCTQPGTWHSAHSGISNTQRQIDAAQIKEVDLSPAVSVNPGFYVKETASEINNTPQWLQQTVHIQAKQLPMQMLISQLLKGTPAQTHFEDHIPRNMPVSLSYSGPLSGALEAIAIQTDTEFEHHDNIIDWHVMTQKTFEISFMPGASNYLVGRTAESSLSVDQGSSDVATTKGQLGTSQYSNLQAQLSVWHDVKATLDDLKSKEGKVMISEATSSVTVIDHPSRVRAIKHYIDQLNADLSKEVSIQVQVLEIDLNKEFNYGVDWQLVERMLNTDITLSGALGSAAAISGATASASGQPLLAGLTSIRVGKNSHAILNALSEQGELSVVTQPRVTTMNNQIAEIRITKDTGYLHSISSTAIPEGGVQVSLTPGKVTDGFTLFLLPKIQKDDIYLQISSTISTLDNLVKVGNASSSEKETQAIQVPTLSEKHFNQRTRVKSGTTLIITGFKQLRDEVQQNALLGIGPIGGKGAKHINRQTLILITPTLIEN